MEEKPFWLRLLLETIGIPACIAFILGIPAIGTFIYSIWDALDTSNKIIAISFGTILLISVILFIISRTNKVLYVIPDILRKMNERTTILSSRLKIDILSLDDVVAFMSLTSIDTNQVNDLALSIKDTESLKNAMADAIQIGQMSGEYDKPNTSTLWRAHQFLFRKIGLEQALKSDRIYNKLGKQLSKIHIPNVEIQQSIFDFINESNILGTSKPLLNTSNSNLLPKGALPLKYQLDIEIGIDEGDKKLKLLLAKITAHIDKYYTGTKKDEAKG